MSAWLESGDGAWQLAGWTMLHFLWLGTLVGAAGGAMRVACRRAAPGVRYGASLLTLSAVACVPVGVAAWLGKAERGSVAEAARETAGPVRFESSPLRGVDRRDSTASDRGQRVEIHGEARGAERAPGVIDRAPTAVAVQGTDAPRSPRGAGNSLEFSAAVAGANPSPGPSVRGRGISRATAPLAARIEDVVRYLPWVWVVGAPFTLALLAVGLVGSERLRRAGAPVEGSLAEVCQRVRTAMRITRRVALAACDGLAQPVLVGIVRPTILLPAAAMTGWSPEQLEMVLVHELAHVRRWDNLVNLAQRLVESALFFHPAVWLASRQVRRDREDCCDAAVVAYTRRPEEYAELLVSIARRRRPRGKASRLAGGPFVAASAMADHPLAGRIRRILKLEDEPMWVSRSTLGLAIVLAASLLAAVVALPPSGGAVADDASRGPSPVAAATGGGEDEAGQAQGPIAAATPDAAAPVIRRRASAASRTHAATASVESSRRKYAPTTEANPTVDVEFKWQHEDAPAELKAQIASYEEQLRLLEDQIEDIETLRHVASENDDRFTFEVAVDAAVAKDPRIATFRRQLHKLDRFLALEPRLEPDERTELEFERAKAEAQLQQHRRVAEQDARERLLQGSDDELVEATAQYRKRVKMLAEQKADVTAKLQEAESRLEALERSDWMAARRASRDQPATPPDARHAATSGRSLNLFQPPVSDFEVADLREEMRAHRAALLSLEQAKEDLEVRKRLAEQQARSTARIDAAVAAELATDRWGSAYDQSRMELYNKLRALGPGENSARRQRLIAERDVLEKEAAEYRADAEEKIRAREAALADEHLQSELIEYEIRVKSLAERRAELENKLQEGEKQLERLIVAARSGDPTQTGEPYYFWHEAGAPEWREQAGADPAPMREPPAAEVAAPDAGEPHAATLTLDFAPTTRGRGAPARSPGAGAQRYDGKTFDEWRSLWRNELKIERRSEAVAALAAFGRAGVGREAAEAILDVASQYDFQSSGTNIENNFRNAVLEALTHGPVEWKATSLAALVDGLQAEPPRYENTAAYVLQFVRATDATTMSMLQRVASDSRTVIRDAAAVALIESDWNLSNVDNVKILRKALSGDEPSLAVLTVLQFRHLDKIPEQWALLVHKNLEVQLRARALLNSPAMNDPTEFYPRLMALLDDEQTGDARIAALRAMASYDLPPTPAVEADVVKRLKELLLTGDANLLEPALVAYSRLRRDDPRNVVRKLVDDASVTTERKLELREALDNLQVERKRGDGAR